MSIELLKKKEDLKQSLTHYSEQLSRKTGEKKIQCISNVLSDFTKFFNEKGFQVDSKTGQVVATYGNLKATLSYEDPSTTYMGAYFRFDLDLTGLNKSKTTILLNDAKPGVTSSNYSYRTEEEKLKKEISNLEKDIERIKSRIENFDNESWSLYIKDDTKKYGNLFSEPYSSMYDLLSDLIK